MSAFAVLGDLLSPRSFAGLLGAAPSVALATVALTLRQNGALYAAREAATMPMGAAAFLLYSACVAWALRRARLGALRATILFTPIWFLVAFGVCRGLGK